MAVPIEDALGSFVSMALALSPNVRIGDELSGQVVEFSFGQQNKLSEQSILAIDALMEKYAKIKDILVDDGLLGLIEPSRTMPQVNFEPNVKYELVTVDKEQMLIATQVAKRLRRIDNARSAGLTADSVMEYDDLQTYLSDRRARLIGDFASVPEIDDVIGCHAVGRNANPAVRDGGAIIFVMIKVYLM